MMFHRRLFFLACLLLIPGWAKAQAGEPPLKVLFIGNSYTYVNDLPSLIVGLADATGGRKIEIGQHLPGGYTFERHVKDKKAIEKIREKKWDVVILQENSLQSTLNRESMHQYARILHGEISKQGAKTVFYLTWARQHIPQMQDGADPATSPGYARAMYQVAGAAKATDFEAWCKQHKSGLAGGVNGAYFDIAKELNAGVAPVGVAWKKALAAHPNLVLHQPDKSHPAPKGSYLAACVFYATLLDKSPVGLPGEVKKGAKVLVRVAPDEARMLQEIAWQAVQEGKQRQEPIATSPIEEPSYHEKTLKEWVALANDSDPQVRGDGVAALKAMGAGAVPALTEWLNDEDIRVQADAAFALRKIGPQAKAAIPALTRFVKEKDGSVRVAAAWALAKIDPETKLAIPALTELLQHKNGHVRASAAIVLCDIDAKAKAAIPVLTELLQHKNAQFRYTAALNLCNIDPKAKAAVPVLTEILKNGDLSARSTAAEALGKIGPEAKSAVPALVELLKDNDVDLRWAVAEALGRIGPEAKTAIPALTKLLNDVSSPVQAVAAEALKKIEEK